VFRICDRLLEFPYGFVNPRGLLAPLHHRILIRLNPCADKIYPKLLDSIGEGGFEDIKGVAVGAKEEGLFVLCPVEKFVAKRNLL